MPSPSPTVIAAAVALVSVVAFAVFGWDKRQASRGGRRVPEATLLTLAALGGLPGALLGMRVFRHKTRKGSFRLAVAGVALAWIALAAVAVRLGVR